MAIELITGVAGTAHVDSADVGAFNAAAYGNGSYIMKGGGCTMQNANTARVAASELLIQGRHVRITGNGEDAVIDNGNVGLNRNDLVCAKYVSSGGIESVTVAVLKGTAVSGTPADPTIPSGSIIAGDPEAWVPLYRVTINGLVPATPVRMISNADNIPLIDHKHSAADVTSGTLAISRGGTGASSAEDACTNIGAVKKSGDTMTGLLTSSYSGARIIIKDTNVKADSTTTPSSKYDLQGILLNDKNGNNNGRFGVTYGAEGNISAIMLAVRNIGGSTKLNVLGAGIKPDGTRFYCIDGRGEFRDALGLGNATGALPIANGGTGKTTAADALAALGGISIKKLWTNSSPTSSFGAQTVSSIPISSYSLLIIIAYQFATEKLTIGHVYEAKDSKGEIIAHGSNGAEKDTRKFTISRTNGTIAFESGYYSNGSVTGTDNKMCVPVAIYGVKGAS